MKLLAYEKFDCIICLDSELPSFDVFQVLADIPIFAADGAVFKLNKMHLNIEAVIGDLDTFDRNIKKNTVSNIKKIRITEQETNDFEKTLKYVLSKNYKNCLILGINGGELEHTLNNWSVYIKYSKLLNLCIYTKNRYGIILRENTELVLNKEEIVSLIPQPEALITTNNLYWDLTKEKLELGVREGARNRVRDSKVLIEIYNGEILCFFDARLPKAPVLK